MSEKKPEKKKPNKRIRPEQTTEESENLGITVSDREQAEPTEEKKPEKKKPSFTGDMLQFSNDVFIGMAKDGLYKMKVEKEGENTYSKISGHFEILANVSDKDDKKSGRLFKWRGIKGTEQRQIISFHQLRSEASEALKVFNDGGLWINTRGNNKALLLDYCNLSPVRETATITNKIGWFNHSFILPKETIGSNSVFYFEVSNNNALYDSKGEHGEWVQNVARFGKENPLILFFIGFALTAPFLHITGQENIGFHIYGQSSKGKTTLQKIASSVIGNPSEVISNWDSTNNGIERSAIERNDSLLCLDEIDQANSEKLTDIIYLLGNGKSKARATSEITLRKRENWRVCSLSTGENRIEAILQRVNRRKNAGIDVRLIEIEANGLKDMGIFTSLQGMESAEILARHLDKATRLYHGTAFKLMLKYLTNQLEEDESAVKDQIELYRKHFIDHFIKKEHGQQVKRVSGAFSLIYAVLLIASNNKILPYEGQEINNAVSFIYRNWLLDFGILNKEEQRLKDQIREHFRTEEQKYYHNGFLNAPDQRPLNIRLGYYKEEIEPSYNRELEEYEKETSKKWYCFPKEFIKIVCKGYEEKFVRETLINWGLNEEVIELGTDNRTNKPTIYKKAYVKNSTTIQSNYIIFTSKVLEGD